MKGFQVYAASTQRFLQLAQAAGADIPLSNHQLADLSFEKMKILKTRGPKDPNPFVMGPDAVKRFLNTYGECAKTYEAQMPN